MNKIKANVLDQRVWNIVFRFVSIISTIFSFILTFIDSISSEVKVYMLIVLLVIFLVFYIGVLLYVSFKKEIKINVNSSTLNIMEGDIFNQDGLKVIAFNEFFDTQADNILISQNSLNGKYINKFYSNEEEVLDKKIEADIFVQENFIEEVRTRKIGKKNRYELGTIFRDGDFLLTAFSKFDGTKAKMTMADYVSFLINFWFEVDRVYNGETVSLPLIGSGITRKIDFQEVTEQELIEIIIWTFKISRVKFTYPATINIILPGNILKKVNFNKLKGMESSGI